MSDNWREVNGIWRGFEYRKTPPAAAFVAEVDAALEGMSRAVLEHLDRGNVAVWVVRRLVDLYDFMGWQRRQLRGWGKGEDERFADGIYLPRGWTQSNGRVLSVVLLGSEYFRDGRWRQGCRVPYILAHEMGHAFGREAARRQGSGARYWRSEFRRTYLEERATASAGLNRYFTWHWAAGLTETYAEAFALLNGGATEVEPQFRAAFPRCIELVRADVAAITASWKAAA